MKNIRLLICILFFCHTAAEGRELSKNGQLSKRHVFYLHGAIIELGDPRPNHKEYGVYDYPAIVSALSKYEFQVISEQRKRDTDHLLYATKVVDQVNSLIASGAKAENITVVGFSKGGMITAIVSSLLARDDVNFVIMATCGEWYDNDEYLKSLRLRGNIFSVYEKSDIAGSCKSLASREPVPLSFAELGIDTGKKHGAFFLPREEWLNPVVSWIRRNTVGIPVNSPL